MDLAAGSWPFSDLENCVIGARVGWGGSGEPDPEAGPAAPLTQRLGPFLPSPRFARM